MKFILKKNDVVKLDNSNKLLQELDKIESDITNYYFNKLELNTNERKILKNLLKKQYNLIYTLDIYSNTAKRLSEDLKTKVDKSERLYNNVLSKWSDL